MLPPLLADVNVAIQVVAFLRDSGLDVASVYERGLAHLDDAAILELARQEKRFVLTHDADFGLLDGASGDNAVSGNTTSNAVEQVPASHYAKTTGQLPTRTVAELPQ